MSSVISTVIHQNGGTEVTDLSKQVKVIRRPVKMTYKTFWRQFFDLLINSAKAGLVGK
ncbi:BSD domain-containing protein [Kiloniella spongiae]|uniref:hypothetical protein n=1 Tax=Kiloniella spongiae TaxID=1489064 RepID=UPI0012DFF138|nr:hypothetical protein [Kiloniella spongiae]